MFPREDSQGLPNTFVITPSAFFFFHWPKISPKSKILKIQKIQNEVSFEVVQFTKKVKKEKKKKRKKRRERLVVNITRFMIYLVFIFA
jgi:hypothetical protein